MTPPPTFEDYFCARWAAVRAAMPTNRINVTQLFNAAADPRAAQTRRPSALYANWPERSLNRRRFHG